MMNFRSMTEEDLPFFNRVRNSARHMLHCNKEFSLAETKEWYGDLSSKDLCLYILVSLHTEPVGYFRLKYKGYSSDGYNINEIGMDLAEEYRGLGLAFEAYNKFFDAMKEYRIHWELEVLGHNVVGYNLYKKLGFTPYALGQDANHDGRLIPSIKMVKFVG